MGRHTISSPFIGLVPYSEVDARFFFGRGRDTRVIISNLFASRLTLLYGASGVGKSSVLQAGVLSQLRQRIARAREEGETARLAVVYFKDWQGDVLGLLRKRIYDAVGDSFDGDTGLEPVGDSLLDFLLAVSKRFKGNVMVILDQFEEYFLYHPDDDGPRSFARQFAEAANSRELKVRFLLSLRDDAVSKLDRFKTMIPNLFSNYLRLQHLDAEAAREAIVRPVTEYNSLPEKQKSTGNVPVEVEPDLVASVVEEVSTGRLDIGDRGEGRIATAGPSGVETPYLQLVMTRLWDKEVDSGSHSLRLATLTELGGAKAIVENHLTGVMDALSQKEREHCSWLFKFLVTPSGTKIAHTVADLAAFADVSAEEIEPVLEKLSSGQRRILTPVAPPFEQDGGLRYEIYHDSLGHAVLQWRRAHLEAQEREEERRKAKEQAREVRRFRRLSIALGVTLALAVGAGAAAWWQWTSSRRNEARAVKAEQLAEARASELTATNQRLNAARAEADGNVELAAQLRAEAELSDQDAERYRLAAEQTEVQRTESERAAAEARLLAEQELDSTAGLLQDEKDRSQALSAELDEALSNIETLERDLATAAASPARPEVSQHKVTFTLKTDKKFLDTFQGSNDAVTIVFSDESSSGADGPGSQSILREFTFPATDTKLGQEYSFERRVDSLRFLDAKYIRVLNYGANGWDGEWISLAIDGQEVLRQTPLQPRASRLIENFNEKNWEKRSYWEAELIKIRVDSRAPASR